MNRPGPGRRTGCTEGGEQGQKVLVAGLGTLGIGLALAKEIAKKGVNVVLVSRSMDKLKVVARAHTHEQPRTTRVCTLKDTGRRACLPGGRSEEH